MLSLPAIGEGVIMEQILINIATQVLGAAAIALATALVQRLIDRYVKPGPVTA